MKILVFIAILTTTEVFYSACGTTSNDDTNSNNAASTQKSDALTDDAVGLPETSKRLPPCGPHNCTTCCDVWNRCVKNLTQSNCTLGGEKCRSCPVNLVCNKSAGRCQKSTICTQASCPGCCIEDTCHPGKFANACGKGANLCMDCTKFAGSGNEGLKCVNFQCAP